ncbi:MAG: hypothetical protein MMC23_007601 [Stictis urceolatum]|nr:hypothetical protein [Stictis urceolata]
MTSSPRRRIEALNKQLQPPPAEGTFEGIPTIRKVAGDSAGPRCKGKVVIITGTNSPLGIGRASAHQFAANGARAIFICDFNDTHLDTHKREIKSLYPDVEVHPRQFDAADERSIEGVVGEALRLYGRLDVFFANAAIVGQNVLFNEIGVEDFEKTFKTNVTSVFLAAKHASKAMQQTSEQKPAPGGSIIATASVAGLRSNAGGTDYSASKAAVISLMQTCSYQMQRTNVRCNAICPGLIQTGMTNIMYEMARERGTEAKIGQLNPMGRGAVADEVARVALFLGSDEASYVNGQAWAVCGGLSAGHPVVPGKLG